MNPLTITQKVRLAIFAVGIVCTAILCFTFWGAISSALHGHRKAVLSANQTKAVSDSAKDAVNATGAVSARQQASDDLTRETADAIHSAKGADAPVDPAARDAGLIGLCKRRVYSGDPKCLRFTPAR